MRTSSSTIILIHGLGRSPASMMLMSWWLRRAGFQVQSLAYPSTSQTVAASIADIRAQLKALPAGPLCLIGHSLGGLIGAALLRDSQGLDIQAVVQLGAPNRGSPMVDRVGWLWPVRRACGPALEQLRSRPAPNPRSPQIAAIGGTAGWPLISRGFERPNDSVVTLRSAWSGAGHRGRVHVLHSFLPLSPGAIAMTLRFLREGRLERA